MKVDVPNASTFEMGAHHECSECKRWLRLGSMMTAELRVGENMESHLVCSMKCLEKLAKRNGYEDINSA